MELTTYTKKPRELSGVTFDGSLSDAQSIQDWVQQSNGLSCALAPDGEGYALYVPSPSGTNYLAKGMTLLQDVNDNGIPIYYPISAEELARNYDEQPSSNTQEPDPGIA